MHVHNVYIHAVHAFHTYINAYYSLYLCPVFGTMPLRCRFRCPACKTNHKMSSFIPVTINLFNDLKNLLCVCVCVCVCVHVCMHACVCVYIYIYIYNHIFTCYTQCQSEQNVIALTGINKVLLYILYCILNTCHLFLFWNPGDLRCYKAGLSYFN